MAWAVFVNGELVAVTTEHKDALALRDSYQSVDGKAAEVKPYTS